MGKVTSVRMSDSLEQFLIESKIDKRPGGVSAWINENLEAIITGQLIKPEELDTKDMDDLKKEKLKVEIEIANGKKVIAQAHALDLEAKRLDNEYKALRNERLRKSLGLETTTPAARTHQELAHDASKATLQVRTWPCTNGCKTILRWPTNQEAKDRKTNRPIEVDTNLTHHCPNYRRDQTATTPSAKKEETKPLDFEVKCTQCDFKLTYAKFAQEFEPIGTMQDAMHLHVRQQHGRVWLEPSEQPDAVATQKQGGQAP